MTGLGIISPIRNSISEAWANLLASTCGITALPANFYTGFHTSPCNVAAIAQPIDISHLSNL